MKKSVNQMVAPENIYTLPLLRPYYPNTTL